MNLVCHWVAERADYSQECEYLLTFDLLTLMAGSASTSDQTSCKGSAGSQNHSSLRMLHDQTHLDPKIRSYGMRVLLFPLGASL